MEVSSNGGTPNHSKLDHVMIGNKWFLALGIPHFKKPHYQNQSFEPLMRHLSSGGWSSRLRFTCNLWLVSVYNDFPASRSLSAWPLRNLDTLPTSSFDVSFPSNHSPSYLISMATAKVALRCWEAWGLQSSPWPGCSEEIMKADKLPRPGSTRSSWLFRAGSRAPGVWLLCRVRAEVWGCHSRAAQKLQNSAESFGDGYPPTSIGIVFWVRRTLAEIGVVNLATRM